MKLRKDQGVTLISLVVIIIVMLILAVVAINSAIGSQGIITNAQKVHTMSNKKEIEDDLRRNYVNFLMTPKGMDVAGTANAAKAFCDYLDPAVYKMDTTGTKVRIDVASSESYRYILVIDNNDNLRLDDFE